MECALVNVYSIVEQGRKTVEYFKLLNQTPLGAAGSVCQYCSTIAAATTLSLNDLIC